MPVIVSGLALPFIRSCSSQFVPALRLAGKCCCVHGVRPATFTPGAASWTVWPMSALVQSTSPVVVAVTQITLGRWKLHGYCGLESMFSFRLPAAATTRTLGLAVMADWRVVFAPLKLIESFTIRMPCWAAHLIAFPAAAALHVAGGTEFETFVRLQMRSGTMAACPCEADCTMPATNVPCQTQSEVSVFFARKFHPGRSCPPRFGATPVSATPTETVAAAAPVEAASATLAATIAIGTRHFDSTRHPLSRTLPDRAHPVCRTALSVLLCAAGRHTLSGKHPGKPAPGRPRRVRGKPPERGMPVRRASAKLRAEASRGGYRWACSTRRSGSVRAGN